MRKKITFLLVTATMLLALSIHAQNVRQAFKKAAATSAKMIPVKTGEVKGVHKKLTAQEIKAAKANGDKQRVSKGYANSGSFTRSAAKPGRFAHHAAKAGSSPASVPYEADFYSSEKVIDDFIIINNNNDISDGEPCTWGWSGGNGAYYVYNEDGETAADDYLVLPITLEGGKTYDVTVNAATWNYPEVFEVVAGTECSAAGLTTVIIEKTTPENDPADYTGTFTPESDGVYYVAIHCISEADQYMLSVYRFSIDVAPDLAAPAAVSDFTVAQVAGELKNTVAFTAPTTTISGDELTENVAIELMRDGELIATLPGVAPGSERTYTDEVAAEGTYRYQAVASNAAGRGRKSDNVSVRVVMPRDIPYVININDADGIDDFLVIDNNGDGSTWGASYDGNAGIVATYQYDWDNDADDYLVSLPLRLEAGKRYEVTVRAAASSIDEPERFEVLASTSLEGDWEEVIPPTDVTSLDFADFTGTFAANEDGLYYVAIHAISDANRFYLLVSDLCVEKGAEATAPAAPVLAGEAAALGALSATISVTAPTQLINGSALAAITKVELYRNNTLIAEQAGVAPGAVITFDDEAIEASGLYYYHAVAYNESGNGEKSKKLALYVGIDQPSAPENVEADDHGTTVDFRWNAVTTGLHDGYVDLEGVTYDVCPIYITPYYLLFGDEIASVTGQTSVTADFNTDAGSEQEYTYFAVRATNEATDNKDNAAWDYTTLFTGKPYDLPLAEHFANEELHYFWESNGMIMITDYASDGDRSAMALLTQTPGSILFMSGKLNLKDTQNPKVVFSALSPSISQLSVFGSIDGKDNWSLLQTVSLQDEDYQSYQVSLNSLKNHERYAQILFMAQYKNAATIDDEGYFEDYGDYIFIDDIRVGDFRDYDLTADIFTQKSVTAGKAAPMAVAIENVGLKEASNYTVTVTASTGLELLRKTVAEPLPSFEINMMAATMPTTVFDETGDVTITVTIDYAADQNTANNTITDIFTIEEPSVVAPGSLAAQLTESGVELTWTTPVTVAEEYTEDFESGLDDFTQIDADGDDNWWVFMSSDELKSHSGTRGMQSYSWVPGEDGGTPVHPDNWLVTPLAILDGTFSFWAAAQDSEWPDEHFAVYVSTKGNQQTEDFEQVSEEFTATPYSMEYTVDLSSYAGQTGYIAIRHFNSYDNFALVVDDISFTKVPDEPLSYNIYVDGRLIDNVAADDGSTITATIDADELPEGECTLAVTAVYSRSKESRPVTATITIATGIRQMAANGKAADIYTIDGKKLSGAAAAGVLGTEGSLDAGRDSQSTLPSRLRKGIYIINGKTVGM